MVFVVYVVPQPDTVPHPPQPPVDPQPPQSELTVVPQSLQPPQLPHWAWTELDAHIATNAISKKKGRNFIQGLLTTFSNGLATLPGTLLQQAVEICKYYTVLTCTPHCWQG